MDLSQTWCNIHYKNLSTGLEGIYIVPFYDIFTMSKEGKILIPWNLDATVLSAAGTVQFSFHFYKIGEKTDDSLQMYMGDAYSVPVNIAGIPALTLPCGIGEGGMPVGMQLIGPAFSEGLLYRAGFAFESTGK